MKYIIAIIAFQFLNQALAADYGYKSKSYGYKSNEGYESPSGTKYQYDLNNQVDRIKYQNDFDARRRDNFDSINSYKPSKIIDDAYGQSGRGGGILDE